MLTSYSGFICRWKSFSSVWHVTKEMHVDLISAWSDNIIVLNMLAAAEFADHFIGICIVWNLSSIFKDSLFLEMALGQTVQAKPSARPNPRKWPKWRFRSDFPNRCYRQKTEFEHQTQNSTSVGLSEPIRSTSSSDMSEGSNTRQFRRTDRTLSFWHL